MSIFERLTFLIKKAVPRFFSVMVYSAEKDRFFEAKTPCMLPLEILSRWFWGFLELREELVASTDSLLPKLHIDSSKINVYGGDSPLDFRHHLTPKDLTFDYNSVDILSRAERFLYRDGRRQVETDSELTTSRKPSFEDKVLESKWQGVPFLMRHDRPCRVGDQVEDVYDLNGEWKEFDVSFDDSSNPVRSLMYHMAIPLNGAIFQSRSRRPRIPPGHNYHLSKRDLRRH